MGFRIDHPEALVISTHQKRLSCPTHTPDHLRLPIIMVEAMDDCTIFATSLPFLRTLIISGERFQAVHGRLSSWQKIPSSPATSLIPLLQLRCTLTATLEPAYSSCRALSVSHPRITHCHIPLIISLRITTERSKYHLCYFIAFLRQFAQSKSLSSSCRDAGSITQVRSSEDHGEDLHVVRGTGTAL